MNPSPLTGSRKYGKSGRVYQIDNSVTGLQRIGQVRLLTVIAGLLMVISAAANEEAEVTEQYFPQQISAKKLLVYCASSAMTKSGRERRQYCAGFVSGVEEAVRLLHLNQPAAGYRICVPEGTSAREIAKGYIGYASTRQKNIDQAAVMIVIEALQNRYPCK